MQIRFERVGLNELKTLQSISIETFKDTFEKDNTEKDMADYLSTACSKEKLKAELENDNAFFYFLYFEDELAGYMKLNLKEAQTENIDPAKAFYRTKGFEKVGTHSFYMGEDEQLDWIMQVKLLEK